MAVKWILPGFTRAGGTYRRQMNRQLTVQESHHELARDVCHGKRGTIHQTYSDGMEDAEPQRPARVFVGGQEAAGDLRRRFDHGERLRAGWMEGLDAVDDEHRPDRGVRVVGVEHELDLGPWQGQRGGRVLYHHFGSKLGLYTFVRADVERRLLDRMEGALAASGPESDRSAAVTPALLVGLDFATREGFLHILGDPPAGTEHDRLTEMLSGSVVPAAPLVGRVLAAAWRAALAAIAEGAEPEQARAAIEVLRLHFPDGD